MTTLLLAAACSASAWALTVDNLRVESLRNPSGIDVLEPHFTWRLLSEERNVVQTSYRLVITTDAAGADAVYDSGVVESSASVSVPAKGASLQPATRYYWRVTVGDNKGNMATSSETACFETGLLSLGWSNAKWIKYSEPAPDQATATITDSSPRVLR